MELHKLKAEDIRSWEPAKLKESADEIRHELAKIRMDIYTAKAQQSAKFRGLKKSLARLLTVSNEQTKAAKAGN